MTKDSKTIAHISLFVVSVIYGLNYSLAKDVMPTYVQPLGFILIRAIGGTFLFWAVSLAISWEKVEMKDMGRLVLSGFFGVACNQMLFFMGLNDTTPINAAVMMTINPILVMLLSAILLKEKLKTSRIVGIGLGIVGALFLITRGAQHLNILSSDTSIGNLLVLLNATSYAAYLVVVKPLMRKYKPITVIRWVFLFGLLMVIPFGYDEFSQIEWGELPNLIWWEIAFVVVCTTFMAYLLNIFALKTVTPTTASFYIYLQPLIAAVAAILLGKDELTFTEIISAVLLFSGVYFVSFYKR